MLGSSCLRILLTASFSFQFPTFLLSHFLHHLMLLNKQIYGITQGQEITFRFLIRTRKDCLISVQDREISFRFLIRTKIFFKFPIRARIIFYFCSGPGNIFRFLIRIRIFFRFLFRSRKVFFISDQGQEIFVIPVQDQERLFRFMIRSKK